MATTNGGQPGSTDLDRDVVVVGGGPAGCSAALFTTRYGLDTVVFDRGNSSLRRCAHLENYLGFPAGVDVGTFYDLTHDQVREAGADLVSDVVTSVTRREDGPGFVVETHEDRRLAAGRAVAATTYDGEYLRGLDDDAATFEVHEHGGDTHEHFDRGYADADGRTPVEGLYVAGGLTGEGEQAIVAAGHGARVGRALLADVRRDDGYWDEARAHYDWLRCRAALDHDRDNEGTWRRRFDDHRHPEDEDVGRERYERIRDAEIEFVKSTHLTRDEIDRRGERAGRRLASHLDDEVLLDAVDDERLLRRARELEANSGVDAS